MSNSQPDFWSQRVANEGHIWGDAPSKTAIEMNRLLSPGARILEIGCGYGRDLVYLHNEGHEAFGVEQSAGMLHEAKRQLVTSGFNNSRVVLGNFLTCALPTNYFDAVLSHRVLHLFCDGNQVELFSKKCVEVLRPRGILAVGVRDCRDLNTELMTEFENGVFEYRTRPGHRISYWNEQRFHSVFDRYFQIIALEQLEENETITAEDKTFLTIMLARNRPSPS